MPVRIEWDNDEKTVIRYVFSGAWTWDEYLPCLEKGRQWMAETANTVCILNDMQQVTKFPPNFISKAHNVIGSRPPNTGLAVFVTRSSIFSVLYKILSQLMPTIPTEYILVQSEAEAYSRFAAWRSEHSATR